MAVTTYIPNEIFYVRIKRTFAHPFFNSSTQKHDITSVRFVGPYTAKSTARGMMTRNFNSGKTQIEQDANPGPHRLRSPNFNPMLSIEVALVSGAPQWFDVETKAS